MKGFPFSCWYFGGLYFAFCFLSDMVLYMLMQKLKKKQKSIIVVSLVFSWGCSDHPSISVFS